MNARTSDMNLKEHANYNAADLAYLREKGYSDDEIAAIWDRDAQRGQGPQTHANAPGISATVPAAISCPSGQGGTIEFVT